jgi:hypothetical protein
MFGLQGITLREVETPASLAHAQRVRGHFLRGPIPLDALAAASLLPGKALAVLLLVHHRAAVTGSDGVTLPKGLLGRFGVSRDAKARALQALEQASLIAVEREMGRTSRITLLPAAKHGD